MKTKPTTPKDLTAEGPSIKVLTYATVCSGIECMSVACRGLPLKPVFFSEIEPFPCAVLKAHYPDVPNLGDMSKISVTNKTEITNGTTRITLSRPLDILAGGTPCQDVSVAGKRAGMQEGSGTRSSLAFDFVRLARELGPRYIIWENVAGAIDSKNAPDFLAFLRALGECGYSLAWRVLDAQYVRVDGMERAVPQRRRRVWVVGYSGADESRAAKILFEPDCVAGHTAPRRRTGQGFAYSLAGRDSIHAGVVGSAPGAGEGSDGGCVCLNPNDSLSKRIFDEHGAFHSVCAGSGGGQLADGVCIALDGDKLKPREDQRKGGNGFGINEDGAGYTLTGVDRHGVAYKSTNGKGEEVSATLSADDITQSGQGYVNNSVVQCYENHAQDSRVQGPIDTAPTQGSSNANSAGVSGNNPLVVMRNTPFVKTSHAKGKNGDGEKWEQCELAGTRNAIEGGDGRNQECIVSTNSNGEDIAPTVNANMSKLGGEAGQNQQAVLASHSQMRYIVRRLTPIECERLMGLPDGYTIPVSLRRFFDANGKPSPELVAEFQRIFDTFGAIMADYAHTKPPKPKSAKRVADWLKKISDPAACPDSPRYKGCGNGWATNQPRWILLRLLAADGINPFNT